MICELQIKLGNGQLPVHYYSNKLIREIEQICDSQDFYQLFEAYTRALIYPADHGKTIDSSLIHPAPKSKGGTNGKEDKQKSNIAPELAQSVKLFENVLAADVRTYKQ